MLARDSLEGIVSDLMSITTDRGRKVRADLDVPAADTACDSPVSNTQEGFIYQILFPFFHLHFRSLVDNLCTSDTLRHLRSLATLLSSPCLHIGKHGSLLCTL